MIPIAEREKKPTSKAATAVEGNDRPRRSNYIEQSVEEEPPALPAQLKAVYNFAVENSIMHVLYMLPPTRDFVFRKVAMPASNNFHAQKLFLGENKEFQTWAYIKLFPKKASEVVFYHEAVHVELNSKVPAAQLNATAVHYPFKVFVAKGSPHAQKQLQTFVQYVFLETRQLERVYSNIGKTYLDNLLVGLRAIEKAYQKMGGMLTLS